jgi:hypothetical protein
VTEGKGGEEGYRVRVREERGLVSEGKGEEDQRGVQRGVTGFLCHFQGRREEKRRREVE